MTKLPIDSTKTKTAPAATPGAVSGKVMRAKVVDRPCPEIARGFGIGRIEPLQSGIDRQDDEGHVIVDEAENDREFIVENGQRLGDEPEPIAGRR